MSGLKLILERLAERLKELKDLRLLILFGSLIEGVAHKGSDVDVVIDASEDVVDLVYEELKREFKAWAVHVRGFHEARIAGMLRGGCRT